MIKALIIAASAMLFIGCGTTQFPQLQQPISSVDIVVADERPDEIDGRIGYEGLFYYICPLIPYYHQQQAFFQNYSFAPEITSVVQNSKLFSTITNSDSPTEDRIKADWEMQVYLNYTYNDEINTSYALGFIAIPFYYIGVPSAYSTTGAKITVVCKRRSDGKICTGTGKESDTDPKWVISREFQGPDIREVVQKAFREALIDCLEGMKQAGFIE